MKFYLIVAKGSKQGMPIPVTIDLFLVGSEVAEERFRSGIVPSDVDIPRIVRPEDGGLERRRIRHDELVVLRRGRGNVVPLDSAAHVRRERDCRRRALRADP